MASILRLAVRPVPEPLWGINLRNELGKKRWRKLRASLLEGKVLLCEICAAIVAESKNINAHEEWTYDASRRTAIAKLNRIMFVCTPCHSVEHFMRTTALMEEGKASAAAVDQAIEHFCKVNCSDRAFFKRHLAEAHEEWRKLSARKWQVDFGEYSTLLASRKRVTPRPTTA